MIPGDDPTPWNLLHDGTIVRIERDLSDEVSLWIDVPYVRARLADGGTLFRFRLTACTFLEYTPYDEPPIIELAAIASSEPTLVEARFDLDRIVVWGSAGVLRLSYASLALELDTGRVLPIEDLRRVVKAYWDEWRVLTAPLLAHPAIRAALDAPSLRDTLPALLAAWRTERTSELAKAIEIIDERTRGPAPARLDGVDSIDAWIATWSKDPGAALAELVRRARRCWDELMAEHDHRVEHSRRRTTPPDAIELEFKARHIALWAGFARCLAALRGAEPDPRIGRAVEDALRSPSEHWFRGDQVHHIVPQAKQNDDPSFADHALALLEIHADAGTANRLHEFANRLASEADCNDAEMVDALRPLATRLAARHPDDRKLADAIAVALRSRT